MATTGPRGRNSSTGLPLLPALLLLLLTLPPEDFKMAQYQICCTQPLTTGTYGIICYDCHSDEGTCNEGECEGAVCIKMETANKENDRRTIQKSCGDEMEEVVCQQSGFGSKWTSRCVCDRPLCNGDAALVQAGLESSSARPPAASFSQMALLIAILVFAGASCSLLVVATVCVQFC